MTTLQSRLRIIKNRGTQSLTYESLDKILEFLKCPKTIKIHRGTGALTATCDEDLIWFDANKWVELPEQFNNSGWDHDYYIPEERPKYYSNPRAFELVGHFIKLPNDNKQWHDEVLSPRNDRDL